MGAAPGPILLSACPLHGAPMDRRSLLDTVTTLSVSGRCLLLAPDRNPATKKSPAPPLLKKALPQVELDLRAVCPLHSEQQALCAHRLHCHCWATCPCAYAALPDFCGCNLNKLEGQIVLYLLAVQSMSCSNLQ